MRSREILLVSLLLNAGLATALFFRDRLFPPPTNSPESISSSTNPISKTVRTNVVVRRQFFTWQEIESEDYRKYIANLRSISCPEETIRDIILSEINTLFEKRRATEIITPEQQWWRSVPDPEVIKAAQAQWQTLDAERRTLLTDLLGPHWEVVNSSQVHGFNIPLDGPILGNLSFEVKQALAEIETRTRQQRQAHLENQQKAGKPADPSELARLQLESRKELAAVLTPQQLEEYLLRYSYNAHVLRNELRGFGTSPEEFRKLFRARDEIDQELQLLPNDNPSTALLRTELERRREEAVKQSLGPERYQLFQHHQDPLFREAQITALQSGAPPEAVLPFYQINQATEQERQRIHSDTTLTPEQRTAALANAFFQQQESLRKILGDAAYERYREASSKPGPNLDVP